MKLFPIIHWVAFAADKVDRTIRRYLATVSS